MNNSMNDWMNIFYMLYVWKNERIYVLITQRLAWEISAIRQVFRIKKAYVRKMLNMDVAWLESRHSGQVASMLHESVGHELWVMSHHLNYFTDDFFKI